MDDPWGSPWASTDTPSDNDPSSSRTNAFLSPPPKAFFGNATSLSAQSAWSGNNDDDGLGIWTTADRVDGTDNQSEWGTWAESGLQPPRRSPRLSVSGKESPLAWPENAAASPVLMMNSRSRTPSIFRHHSPDPWATELSLADGSDINTPISLIATTSDPPKIDTATVQETLQTYQTVIGSGNRSEESPKNEEYPVKGETASKGTGRTIENDLVGTSRKLVEEHVITSSKPDLAACELPSRPSSTFSQDSHDGPERPDSPITSIDEDRGARIQKTLGKSSGKVQELVGIYDGLTRAASEEPPTIDGRGVSQTRNGEQLSDWRGNGEDDEVGFGDFKHAPVNDERAPRSSGEASMSSELSSTPKAEIEDGFAQEYRHGGQEDRTTIIETGPVPVRRNTKTSENIYFDTNLGLVDKLFPDLPKFLGNESTGDWEAPDHIISDSFSTILERKAWYRVSRYGSMRKHNSGDDENYYRVTWSTSQLHDDTIKIVRRWMEQDSYAGRAILGGTKRTGFFDWDSGAAPVGLDEVFRRRKSASKHARNSSIPAPANHVVLQSASVDEHPYRNSTDMSLAAELQSASHPIPPTLSFGWNSEVRQATPTSRLSNPSSQGSKVLERTGHSTPTPAPTPRPAPVQTTFAQEDDDDWGEMVSSPHVEETPIQTNVSTFPLIQETSEKRGPTSPLSLAISEVAQPAQSSRPRPPDLQPTMSDSWSHTDTSVLDEPIKTPQSPTARASQPSANFPVFESTIPLPRSDSLDLLNPKSAISSGSPKVNMIPSRAAVDESLAVSVPPNGAPAMSQPINAARIEGGDDLVVQNILQNLPDLSYMLR